MVHNDVIRSIRYMLRINDSVIQSIFKLADLNVSLETIASYMKKEEEEGYTECSTKNMAHFLNGLVTYRRGKDESRPPQAIEVPVTNNTVLKKLRVAFELKDEDIISILEENGFNVTKTELSAFFRKEGHKNYRQVGDQFLRNFLKGLTARVRPS